MRRNVIVAAIYIVVAVFIMSSSVPALAISEGDVQAQVDATSRETVAGNLFIWFLCAIAFLKISQKIDSFMSSLGINVGHTGGSMVAEAMLAARGISEGKSFFSGGFGGKGARGMAGIKGVAGAASSFMGGGLSGAVSRQFGHSAIKSMTRDGGGGIGARMFNSSMEKGGEFANNVTGAIAKGSMVETGSMTGANAVKAFSSYMGYNTQGSAPRTDAPSFSNVEIGGGRIVGTETTADNPSGIQFGMYHADQYMAPEGSFSTVDAADGSKWYKQYAADTVDKSPYMTADGSVAYNESIVQKLPKMPARKDRV